MPSNSKGVSRFSLYRLAGKLKFLRPEAVDDISRDVDARLVDLEKLSVSWESLATSLTNYGLERVNNVLVPLIEQAKSLVSLGAMLSTTSSSNVLIGTGPKTFVIDAEQSHIFAPAQTIAITAAGDPSTTMVGDLVGYDPETAELTIDATLAAGAGLHDDWIVSPSAPANLAHEVSTDNPHDVSAGQVGAYSAAQVDILMAAHAGDTDNPHQVSAGQVGAYSIAAMDVLLAGRLNEAGADALYPRLDGANAGPLAGFRSLLINGDFGINQRGFAGGALTAGSYGHDRWKADTGGADYSVAGDTITLASGTIVQVIESPRLAGETITLSVEDPSGDIDVDVEDESDTITAGSGRRGVTLTVPAGSTGDITVKLSATAQTFKRVQLEVGGHATPFERRPIGVELGLCQRYYVGTFASIHAQRVGSGSTFSVAAHAYPVEMRANPSNTVSAYVNIGGITINGDRFQFRVQGTATGANVYISNVTADAEL